METMFGLTEIFEYLEPYLQSDMDDEHGVKQSSRKLGCRIHSVVLVVADFVHHVF